MKSKTVLTWSVAAALALGLGPAAGIAPAQDQDKTSQCDTLGAVIAKQVDMAIASQTLASLHAQMATLAAQVTNSVNNEVMSRVSGQVQDALASSRALQQQAAALAQEASTMPAVVSLDGNEMMQMDETGWLGVTPDDISADRAKELKLPSARGVYVSDVEKDSPAEKAGLKTGDAITEFNGEHIEGVVQFRRLVRETPPGRSISIAVWRDGRSQTLNATIAPFTDQFQNFSVNVAPAIRNLQRVMPQLGSTPLPTPAAPRAFSFTMPDGDYGFGQGYGSGSGNGVVVLGRTPILGIQAENLNGQLGNYFGAPDGEGVLVTEVQSGTPAEKAGMKAGDVITKVEGDRVRTLGEMQSKLREKRDAKTVQITVIRRGSETTLTVEPNQPRTSTVRGNGRPA